MTEDNKTEVYISVTINTIMDISEVGGYFQVQFDLIMNWYESRLRFKNLKDDMNLNSFLPNENYEVWVPELIFVNTQNKPSTITDDRTSIKVEKKGVYKLSQSSENENIQYFQGSQNPLEMKRFYNQRFLCDYGMQVMIIHVDNILGKHSFIQSNIFYCSGTHLMCRYVHLHLYSLCLNV